MSAEPTRADDAERALFAERILAEQEERRRLAELLHDGPVQHLSAIAQTVDAALATLRDGEPERADEILARAVELSRDAARELRALCEDLEPKALRELGFAAAVGGARAGATRAGTTSRSSSTSTSGTSSASTRRRRCTRSSARATDQAVRRGAPTRIEISLAPTASGGAELVVSDDGPPERRSAVLEALAERAATLNARFSSEVRVSAGSTVRFELPPSAARR